MDSSRFGWVIPVALVTVLSLSALGRTDMWGTDEARYAQAAREMVERGDYTHLTVNGRDYSNKPPILMWCQVGISRITGSIDEFEARFPSAVGGIASVLLIYLIGAVLFGRRAAFWGALFLATTPVFLKESRTARMDVLLTAFTCTSYLGFVLWERKKVDGWVAFLLVFLPLPLGILTKWTGPLFVLPSALLYLILSGQARRIPWFTGIAGLAITLLPLFLYADFGEFGKIVSGAVHRRPFYYHVLRLPAVSMPFVLLIPGVVILLRTRRVATLERRGLLLLGSWVLLNLFMLSLSGSKRSNYLDPLLPPIALAAGWFLSRVCAEGSVAVRRWCLRLPFGLVAATVLLGGAAIVVRPQLVLKSGELPFSLGGVRAAGVIAFLAGGAVLALVFRGREDRAAAGTCGLLAILLFALFAWINPLRDHAQSVRPVTDVFRTRAGTNAMLGMSSTSPNPKWIFYAGRGIEGLAGAAPTLEWLKGDGERFAIVKRRHLRDREVPGDLPPHVQVEVDNRWKEVDHLLLSNRKGPVETVQLGP